MPNSAQPSQATAFCMGLQDRLNLLKGSLDVGSTAYQRSQQRYNRSWAQRKRLATFAGSTMFVGVRVVTEGTIHLGLNEYQHLIRRIPRFFGSRPRTFISEVSNLKSLARSKLLQSISKSEGIVHIIVLKDI